MDPMMQPLGGQMTPQSAMLAQYLKAMQQQQPAPQTMGALGTDLMASALDRYSAKRDAANNEAASAPGAQPSSVVNPQGGDPLASMFQSQPLAGAAPPPPPMLSGPEQQPPRDGGGGGLSGLLKLGMMFL